MKICLCGSTRFLDQFHLANRQLTLAGHVVYSVATASSGAHSELTTDEKLALDAVHLSKIEDSDAVMVVGIQEDGSAYIGESTRREMMYASIRGKPIYFFDPLDSVLPSQELQDFQSAVKAAGMTNADRELQRLKAEEHRKAFLAQFHGEGKAVGGSFPLGGLTASGDEDESPAIPDGHPTN